MVITSRALQGVVIFVKMNIEDCFVVSLLAMTIFLLPCPAT